MSQPYSAGFISGSERLYRFEMRQLIPLLQQGLDKAAIREKVLADNLFLQKSHYANINLFRKVFNRAARLDVYLQDVVMHGSTSDANAVLLYAYLKNYRFLREFAYEVIVYLYRQNRMLVTPAHIADFFERKEEQSIKVRDFTPETKQKMRQVMLKAFVEAGLLLPREREWEIRPIPVSNDLVNYINGHPEYQMLLDISLVGGW